MNERLKALRKTLGLTQAAFGKKIGMSDTSISHMEAGRVPINEQNIRLICITFNVMEKWIRTGEGEMIDEEAELSEYEKRILGIFRRLSPRAQDLYIDYGEKLIYDEYILRGENPDEIDKKGIHPISDQNRA